MTTAIITPKRLSMVLVIGAIAVMSIQRFRLDDLEFTVCLGAMVVALLLLVLFNRDSDSDRESFFDTAADTMRSVLIPKLEQLARSLHSSEKDDQGGGAANKEQESDSNDVSITDEYLTEKGVVASLFDTIKMQYKHIGFFLCNLKSVDAARYDKVLAWISKSTPPPTLTAT